MKYIEQIKKHFQDSYRGYTTNDFIKILHVPEVDYSEFYADLRSLINDGVLYETAGNECIYADIVSDKLSFGKVEGDYKVCDGSYQLDSSEIYKYNIHPDDKVWFEIVDGKPKIKQVIKGKSIEFDDTKQRVHAQILEDLDTQELYIVYKNQKYFLLNPLALDLQKGDFIDGVIPNEEESHKCYVTTVTKKKKLTKVFVLRKNIWVAFDNPNEKGEILGMTDYPEGTRMLCEVDEISQESGRYLLKPLQLISKSTYEEQMYSLAAEKGFLPTRPPEVIEELKSLPNEEEFQKLLDTGAYVNDGRNRVDLRSKQTISIDPPEAQDLDDSFIIEKTPNGWRIYENIADPVAFVSYASAIANDAMIRGTTAYFGRNAIHLYPEKLSQGLCSLNAHTDKFAKTLQVEITEDGQVIDVQLYNSIIRNTRQMDYQTCNDFYATNKSEVYTEQECELLTTMKQLSDMIGSKLSSHGKLDFGSNEQTYTYDENGNPISEEDYPIGPANKVIENLVVFCGHQFALFCNKNNIPILYRNHPNPTKHKKEALTKSLKEVYPGKKVKLPNIDDPKAFQDYLNKLFRESCELEKRYINNIGLQAMDRAYYSPVMDEHYGLGFVDDEIGYAKWSNPIREFSSTVNHWSVDFYLMYGPNCKELEIIRQFILENADFITLREIEEDEFEKVAEYKATRAIAQNYINDDIDATIEFLTPGSVHVKTSENFRGIIRIESGDSIDVAQKTAILSSITYTIGDPITVRISKLDDKQRKIIFEPKGRKKSNKKLQKKPGKKKRA